MAKLKGAIQLTGNLGDLSFYTMRGCEGIVVRRKGGATKEQIRSDSSFGIVRKINSEWSGVTLMAGAIHRTMYNLTRLSDFNSSGQLNAIAKKIQKCDECHDLGERPVQLSKQRTLVAGFSFHRGYPFSAVVKVIPVWEIDRDRRTAIIRLPEFIPSLHLNNFTRLPYFRFVVNLGMVSDLFYQSDSQTYLPVDKKAHETFISRDTDWMTAAELIPACVIEVVLPDLSVTISEMTTFVLGLGIEFGTVGPGGKPQAVRYAGSAVILGLG